MKTPQILLLIAMGALLQFSPVIQAAVVYDFEADFSTNVNTEASTWFYRYQAAA